MKIIHISKLTPPLLLTTAHYYCDNYYSVGIILTSAHKSVNS